MDLNYADYCWDHEGRGFRQRDLTVRQVYDSEYLRVRYADIDANVRALSRKRLQVLAAFVPVGRVLDFGCGTGRFVQESAAAGWNAWGCDLVPGEGRRCDLGEAERMRWDVVTCFDSLEHCPDPDAVIRSLDASWVMVSVPWCHYPDDPAWFRRWKHRRPGEHLWHWNKTSLDGFFALLGYRPVMWSSFEDEYRPNADQKMPNILTAIYSRSARP